jgi:hypothetical protein
MKPGNLIFVLALLILSACGTTAPAIESVSQKMPALGEDHRSEGFLEQQVEPLKPSERCPSFLR